MALKINSSYRKFPARCLKQCMSYNLPLSRCNTRHALNLADICVFLLVACPGKHCTHHSERIYLCKCWKTDCWNCMIQRITSLSLQTGGFFSQNFHFCEAKTIEMFFAKAKQTSMQCIVFFFQSMVRLLKLSPLKENNIFYKGSVYNRLLCFAYNRINFSINPCVFQYKTNLPADFALLAVKRVLVNSCKMLTLWAEIFWQF